METEAQQAPAPQENEVVEPKSNPLTLTNFGEMDLVKDKILALAVFTDGGIEILKNELQAKFDAFKPDVSTLEGRDAIVSFSFKFAKDKKLVSDIAAALLEDNKALVRNVTASNKDFGEFCDEKRKAARAELTEREAEQKEAKAVQAKADQEEANRKEKQRIDSLAALASARRDLLASILGDDYDMPDALNVIPEDEFQEIVTAARGLAEENRKEKEAAAIEEAKVKEAEAAKEAEVKETAAAKEAEDNRKRFLLASRVNTMKAIGMTDHVRPGDAFLKEMSEEDFQKCIKTFKDTQAQLTKEREEREAKERALADRLALGKARKAALLMPSEQTIESLADLSAEDWTSMVQVDRKAQVKAIETRTLQEAEEARLTERHQSRNEILNEVEDSSYLRFQSQDLKNMPEVEFMELLSNHKKAVENKKAEKKRLDHLLITRCQMLVNAGSEIVCVPDVLTGYTEEQWTEFYTKEKNRVEQIKKDRIAKEASDKAAEEENVKQVDAEVALDMYRAVDWRENKPQIIIDLMIKKMKLGQVRHIEIKY